VTVSNLPVGANLVVLDGVVAGEATERRSTDGDTVLSFDLATSSPGTRVPVTWSRPSARERSLVVEGARLTIVGAVRRRFFRVTGSTQSRTEVVVTAAVRSGRRTAAARLVAAFLAGHLDPSATGPEDCAPVSAEAVSASSARRGRSAASA
jgi:hypothetical protein